MHPSISLLLVFLCIITFHQAQNTVPSYPWLLITHKIIGEGTSLTLVAFIIYTWLWDFRENPLGYAPNQTSPLLAGTVFYLYFTILSCFYNL